MKDKDYKIPPPPPDKGPNPLFRVVYTIDVEAATFLMAAKQAWQMMQAPDALAPILTVLDAKGGRKDLDLAGLLEFRAMYPGTVVQTYREDIDGNIICVHQEFLPEATMRYEDGRGKPVKPPKHDSHPICLSLVDSQTILEELQGVLSGLDVGGEQSREFAREIVPLHGLMHALDPLGKYRR